MLLDLKLIGVEQPLYTMDNSQQNHQVWTSSDQSNNLRNWINFYQWSIHAQIIGNVKNDNISNIWDEFAIQQIRT